MAEFKFPCSGCGQNIKVDELWSGHQLECPACHAQITVPANPAAAAAPVAAAVRPVAVHARVTTPAPVPSAGAAAAPPPVPPGPPKLAIGAHKAAAEAPKAAPVVRDFVGPPPKKKSKLVPVITTILVLAALGAGGYFGYDYWQKQKAAKEEAARQAAEAERAAAAAAEAAKHPPPPKELPIIAPVYTLDLAQAKIPEGKANGSISGTNFVVESARVDKVGAPYVLTLRQGSGPSPDRAVVIYLHLKPNEGPTNQNLTVSPEARNPLVSQVVKMWKTDPKYAPRTKTFFDKYAMKLELGQMSDNVIAGKIFLALPDEEQSLVAGVFRATMGQTVNVTEVPAVTPAQTPRSRMSPEMEKRYGIRRN